ncbi:MAG: transrane protein [Chitinophagaceae bacterium]|nr:transrane protein [Chitinophagaceae bacterium]
MSITKGVVREAWLYRMHPVAKLIIGLVIAAIVFFAFPLAHADTLSRVMLAWDAFSLCLLSLYWIIFFTTSPSYIRKLAATEDTSRVVIFIITLISATASMAAVVLLLVTKNEKTAEIKILHLVIAIAGMILSWILVHTVFAVRYAHLYYADHKTKPGIHAGGLNFPDDDKPDFVDFAYFSFVLGMTFQVSDVSITLKNIRRMVLWHSLISFGYNVVIIALTINVVAGLGV